MRSTSDYSNDKPGVWNAETLHGLIRTRLNPENTGLLLVHMDINRNFTLDGDYSKKNNEDYNIIFNFLNPRRPIRTLSAEALPFLLKAVRRIIHPGRARMHKASLFGQHSHSDGIYFGSTHVEENRSPLQGHPCYLCELAGMAKVLLTSGKGLGYPKLLLGRGVDIDRGTHD